MLISPAYAQAGGGADMFASFIPLILIFAVFYFLLVRPQQKKMKQHREMLAAIGRGDRVVTGGGIIGSVSRVVNEDELLVDLTDGVRVTVMRSMVANVLARGVTEDNRDSDKYEGETKPRTSRRSRRRKIKTEETATAEPANDLDEAESSADTDADRDRYDARDGDGDGDDDSDGRPLRKDS